MARRHTETAPNGRSGTRGSGGSAHHFAGGAPRSIPSPLAGELAGAVGQVQTGPGGCPGCMGWWKHRHALSASRTRIVAVYRALWLEPHIWRQPANRGQVLDVY